MGISRRMRAIEFLLQHGTFIKPFEGSGKAGTCPKCKKPSTPLALSGVCAECAAYTVGYGKAGRISWGAVIVRENKLTRAVFGANDRENYHGRVELIDQPFGNPLACAVIDLIKKPMDEPFVLATFSRDGMDVATAATTQFCYPGERLYVSGGGIYFSSGDRRGGSEIDGGVIRNLDLNVIRGLVSNVNIEPSLIAKVIEARHYQDTRARKELVEEYASLGELPRFNTPEYHLLSQMQPKKAEK